jgi:hypothetical protein
MTFEDFTVIKVDASDFQAWRSAIMDAYVDEVNKLEQKEHDALYALKTTGLQEKVTQIKDEYWRQRLAGLAIILGEMYNKRHDSEKDSQKYETFLAKYKEQLEKAISTS